jgi:hypothetical protein
VIWFLIVVAVWLSAVIISFINGRRRFPIAVLALGIAAIAATLFLGLGWIGLAVLAVLTVLVLLANKFDSVM